MPQKKNTFETVPEEIAERLHGELSEAIDARMKEIIEGNTIKESENLNEEDVP